MANRITTFKDLKTWQNAQELAVAVYEITQVFPDAEKFGLTNQLRRASVSISSNIAEGFSRQSRREKLQFYYIAKGSLTEVESQLDLAYRVKYITGRDVELFAARTLKLGKLLTALMRSIPNS